MTQVEVYGIRHHGPGSARSVRSALQRLQPQCVLVEGPPDADESIPYMSRLGMSPPVALLLYATEPPKHAVYYPFAVYSPEWQALDWALENGAIARFADLGVGMSLAWARERLQRDEVEQVAEWRPRDPLALLAKAAGYEDAERWWEHMVEERRTSFEGGDGEIFPALLEGIGALRESLGPPKNRRERAEERLREASMRTILRSAVKEGFERIAFVCGAWHAPVVRLDMGPDGPCKASVAKREDAELLKTLPKKKEKVSCTWIPWTYERLTFESGYGAGVASPGWYDHLWHAAHESALRVGERWMVKVARLLRAQGLEASSAQVIDAVRLADTLSSMRDRPLPGLAEMNEAALAVFCMGNRVPMKVIERDLVVGQQLGHVPPEVPQVPLQRDFHHEVRRLRLVLSGAKKIKISRGVTFLEASRLIHRVHLLGIRWGKEKVDSQRDHRRQQGLTGDWEEEWVLKWEPEFELRLIEMGRYGNTVEEAAEAYTVQQANTMGSLGELAALLEECMQGAGLSQATSVLVTRLQDEAALSADCGTLMDALPHLARIIRIGSVRDTDRNVVRLLLVGYLARIRVGFGVACASLDDVAAESMFKRLVETHQAVVATYPVEGRTDWLGTLQKMIDQVGLHGLVAGRVARILMEGGVLDPDALAQRLALALSTGNRPADAAAWIEGFLRESGVILVHDDRLWALLDQWLAQLDPDQFITVLPLLRRTFSTFSAPERRAMGEQARRGARAGGAAAVDEGLDSEQVRRVLAPLRRILGVA